MLFQHLLELAQISEPTPKLHKSILESVDELRTLQQHRKIEVPTLQSGGNPCFPTPEGSWLESTVQEPVWFHILIYFSSSRHSQVSRSSEGQQHHWDCCHCRVTFLLVQQEKESDSKQAKSENTQAKVDGSKQWVLLAQWWSTVVATVMNVTYFKLKFMQVVKLYSALIARHATSMNTKVKWSNVSMK